MGIEDEDRAWLTPREEAVLAKTVDRAVNQTFIRLGINVSDTEEALLLQRDLRWLRDVRESSERAGRGAALAAITLLVGAIIGSFWLGFRTLVNGGTPPPG